MMQFKLIKWLFAIAIPLFLVGCNAKKDNDLREKFVAVSMECATKGTIFDLARITNFAWDRAYYFNSDSGLGKESIASFVCGEGISIPDQTYCVCFMNGKELARYFFIGYDEGFSFWMNACMPHVVEGCSGAGSTPAAARYEVHERKTESESPYTYEFRCVRS